MENERFELNILAYSIVVVMWILSTWAIVFTIGDSLCQINFATNSLGIILILGILLFPAFIATWAFIVQKTTSFSADGINRLTVLGRKTMKWRDAKSLGKSIAYLEIVFSSGKCQIPLLMYKVPQALVDYIQSQVAIHSSN